MEQDIEKCIKFYCTQQQESRDAIRRILKDAGVPNPVIECAAKCVTWKGIQKYVRRFI